MLIIYVPDRNYLVGVSHTLFLDPVGQTLSGFPDVTMTSVLTTSSSAEVVITPTPSSTPSPTPAPQPFYDQCKVNTMLIQC